MFCSNFFFLFAPAGICLFWQEARGRKKHRHNYLLSDVCFDYADMDQLQITQRGCREPHFRVSSSKTKHQLLSVIKEISDAMTIYEVNFF